MQGESKNLISTVGNGLGFQPARERIDRLAEAVSRMLAPFRTGAIHQDELKALVKTYCTALGEFPIEAVSEAGTNLLCGRVTGYDGRFAPTPPQWAKEARLCHHRMIDASKHKTRPMALPRPSQNIGLSPDELDARKKQVDDLMAKLKGGSSETRRATPAILTPDDELDALAMALSAPIRVSNSLINRINGSKE